MSLHCDAQKWVLYDLEKETWGIWDMKTQKPMKI